MLTQNDREGERNDSVRPDHRPAIVDDRSSSNIGLALAGILLVIAVMAAVALVWLGDGGQPDHMAPSTAQSVAAGPEAIGTAPGQAGPPLNQPIDKPA